MNNSRSAFTLLEVLLVTVLLLIIAGVAAPNFSPVLQNIEFKQTTNDLAYMLRYAQSRAITQNKIVRLQFEEDKASYWLTQEVLPEASENELTETTEESDADKKKTFERVSGRYGKVFHISDSIKVEVENDFIECLPDGRISKEEIKLCQKERCLGVTTKGYRGKVNVIEYESSS